MTATVASRLAAWNLVAENDDWPAEGPVAVFLWLALRAMRADEWREMARQYDETEGLPGPAGKVERKEFVEWIHGRFEPSLRRRAKGSATSQTV